MATDTNLDFTQRYSGGVALPSSQQAGFRVFSAASPTIDLQYVRGLGTTAQRPANAPGGHVYYDTDVAGVRVWNGSTWATIALGAVTSVFGRTGNVVAQQDDYTISQVDNDTTLSGGVGDLSDVVNDLAEIENLTTVVTVLSQLVPDGLGGVEWARISGTSAQRPGTPATGLNYYDTDLAAEVVYNGTTWQEVRSGLSV